MRQPNSTHAIHQRFCKYKEGQKCLYSSLLLGKTKVCEARNCYLDKQLRQHKSIRRRVKSAITDLEALHRIDNKIDKMIERR